MVFGGRASIELAAKIAKQLDVDLGDVKLQTFADGEVYCRYKESIRGAASPSPSAGGGFCCRKRDAPGGAGFSPAQRPAANEAHGRTPNDSLAELLMRGDAAQGASAPRIIAVMPWYGSARQDKKSEP